ncbi:T9SS type A sorting domain-containing protein [Hymenobacter negativus]|uniref:T9SS type A sorting domain-containing protein n=1 Tax=Hymenobacter negativus TaxID=2795026 RepID=A0ABS3QDN3_9BACT|nr:T9SS type A sorting domain-containing protein [Hymenobacter negativus]MBO2009356.1 T9SS type A sorting domain-containing protein [Hymenobacter negativus]
MRTLTHFHSTPLTRLLAALLLALWLGAPAHATTPPPTTGRPLAEALNPDGTLRPGANGSFDARQFRMGTAPDGRPVFRPAGTTGAGDERWADGFGHPTGTDTDVRVVVRAGNDIYIGGNFSVVGSAAASRVARWNGSSWANLSSGVTGANSVVFALAVAPNGDLYAGGHFTQAGGVLANNVAKWNGTTWSALGTSTSNGVSADVKALTVASNGDVYVGGYFSHTGGSLQTGVSASNIAKWNGTAWSALGTGINQGVSSTVNALATAANGDLYVGGFFTFAGATSASGIAKWNGTTWSALGTSATSPVDQVYALAIAGNGDVYVGAQASSASGLALSSVFKWDGASWSSLAMGGGATFALSIAANGDLYVGGQFNQAGMVTAYNVAKWNGTAWSALGSRIITSYCFGLAVAANGDLYTGGAFNQIGGFPFTNVMRWNGTAWNGLGAGNGVSSPVYAVAVATNGNVYIGGSFKQVGGVLANYVARWDGVAWSSLGTGSANGVGSANGNISSVYSLAIASNGDVYVGGSFAEAGGITANNVAKWNGTVWSSMNTGTTTGLNGDVHAVAVASNGDVYAGGDFNFRLGSTVIRGVAHWAGTAWGAVGTGTVGSSMDGSVQALAIAGNGDVYIGGNFTQVGGITANRIAKWNGTAWNSLGTGPANGITNYAASVYAIALASNGDVYVGGGFTQAGGISANLIAKWNGTVWSALGGGFAGNVGFVNNYVATLAIAANGDLYAGGIFNLSGTTAVNYVGRWNGTDWSNLGTSTNLNVLAMSFGPTGKLCMGGAFSTTGDGSRVMANFGIYDPAAPLATAAAKAIPVAQLFPNPAHGTATLRLPAGAPRQPLTLSDALGRVVRRYPAPATAEAELDLRGLPAGTYVVRCGELTQRLVVE